MGCGGYEYEQVSESTSGPASTQLSVEEESSRVPRLSKARERQGGIPLMQAILCLAEPDDVSDRHKARVKVYCTARNQYSKLISEPEIAISFICA